MITNKIIFEAEIEGGKADKLSLEDIAEKFKLPISDLQKELEMGKKVELEHTGDKKLAQDIAMDHLAEIPDYYTRLNKMEEKAKKNITESILKEALLCEEKIVGFQNQNYGNFVILIGSPGAGKTFVAGQLLNLRNFKHLSGDTWLEMVAAKRNIDLRNPDNTAELNGELEDKFKKFRTNFILNQLKSPEPGNVVVDITGKSVASVKKALDLIEDSFYVSTLVYVITSKEECLRRNLMRTRTVPENFLMSIYDDIQNTYHQIFKLFDNAWMVINDELWDAFQGSEEYVEIDGIKKLKSRTGEYKRPSNRIVRVK